MQDLAAWRVVVQNDTGELPDGRFEAVCERLDKDIEYLVRQALIQWPVKVTVDWA